MIHYLQSRNGKVLFDGTYLSKFEIIVSNCSPETHKSVFIYENDDMLEAVHELKRKYEFDEQFVNCYVFHIAPDSDIYPAVKKLVECMIDKLSLVEIAVPTIPLELTDEEKVNLKVVCLPGVDVKRKVKWSDILEVYCYLEPPSTANYFEISLRKFLVEFPEMNQFNLLSIACFPEQYGDYL